MKKYVSLDKRSKKAQKEYYSERRVTWGELNPSSFFVDPIPQALTLTSIVIGACTTAMSLALVIKLKESYGTLDTREIRRLNG